MILAGNDSYTFQLVTKRDGTYDIIATTADASRFIGALRGFPSAAEALHAWYHLSPRQRHRLGLPSKKDCAYSDPDES